MNILRNLIKQLAKLYFFVNDKGNKKKQYIPVSGKVLNSELLENLIDASLDMWLTTGRFNKKFEKALREFFDHKYALTVNSGSSANLLAFSSLTSHLLGERQIKKDDEVICVAAAFPTTVNPIIQNSCIPVFVDIERDTHNINTKQIKEAISEKTKAIFIAHTLGNPFNLREVKSICDQYNLWLIEDNCDAFGSRFDSKLTGTWGDISTLSFYPAHHITTGEGGAVLTSNPILYKALLSMRDWGRDCWCPSGEDNTCGKRFSFKLGNLSQGYDHKYIYSHIGYNLKITDMQAACGLAQIKQVNKFIESRKANFKYLFEAFKNFEKYFYLPVYLQGSDPSWFGFPLTIRENVDFSRVDLVSFLEENNIGTRLLFGGNILRQPAYLVSNYKFKVRNSKILTASDIDDFIYEQLPETDYVSSNTFWIGTYPGLSNDDLDHIIHTVDSFLKR
ncbi:MAG: lipopolysaccharide biosynthesis protein RfbH [Candidatus Caenarcaniphilales bacterium]|nr:lipopolysaccharide biosynthesis protein RfbH [Candidatus Caenarcaniphilales bacterium]